MADIKKTLPQSVGESRGIGEILDSCGTELDLLEQEARAACLRLAAATADSKGCALWERELGLEVREDLPLSARRVLIQVALEQMDTCTPEKLRAFVLRMLEGQVELREDFEGYTVYLAAQVEKFLSANPDFHVVLPKTALPGADITPLGTLFLPHRTGTDGFFAAILERN